MLTNAQFADECHPYPIELLKEELRKPVGKDAYGYTGDEFFDPWRIFDSLYGSYSSEFDDMAIEVLSNIIENKNKTRESETLAHEMFREMLCTSDFCDYGISPRGCFPNWSIPEIEKILTELLAKWREYRIVNWSDH